MNSDINLLKKESRTQEKRVKILRIISVVAAGTVAIFSIALFVFNRQSTLDPIKREQNVVLQNLSFLSEKEAKLSLLNDRLNNLENILGFRKNYIKSVNSIIDELPSDVSTTSLSLDKDGILLIASSNSLSSINTFLNSLIDLSEKKHLIKDLIIESLTVGTTGIRYSLSIKAKLL